MPTLNDIPYEVFFCKILPLISLKEVGSLAMTTTVWRQMCSEQDVWRNLYMRGLSFNITDHSVDLGICCRFRARRWPNEELGATTWKGNTLKFSGIHGWSHEMVRSMRCLPNALKATLLPWSAIRLDDRPDNSFYSLGGEMDPSQLQYYKNVQIYLDYIETEWKAYNGKLGLSQVNLCQCPNHYKFDTLDGPTKCMNSSSFKKIVLKKQLTASKRPSLSERQLIKKEKEYKKIKAYAEKLNAELSAMKHDVEVNDRLRANLTIATSTL